MYNLLYDPEEKKNLIKTDLEKAEKFKSKLLKLRSKIHYELLPSIPDDDEIIKKRLRALGYI